MNIICLNGPPKSGKSEVSRIIQGSIEHTVRDKFAAPLDDVANCLLNMWPEEYAEWREVRKDEPLMTYPTTMRKLLIAISEDMVKPQLGKDYFGIAAANRVLKEIAYIEEDTRQSFGVVKETTFIIDDSGFQNEYNAFKRTILEQYPEQKIRLVQIHRRGCNFNDDSREWVEDDGVILLYNNDSLVELRHKVVDIMQIFEATV